MLYVTTRNKLDTFRPASTLAESRGPDGGFWVPFRGPSFSPGEIEKLREISFNSCLAMVLNKLFDTKLSSWDVDFAIGRYPARMYSLAGKTVMAEPWHNPDWQLDAMASRLTALVGGDCQSGWPEIAVRAAVLFGVYGEMLRQQWIRSGETVDVAVLTGSFRDPMAAWYARKWGLPIENIICCCNENNNVWNLICHGVFRTDIISIPTCIPQADIVLPGELERLISECGSVTEMEDYQRCCEKGETFYPSESTLAAMRNGLYVSVVSTARIGETIPGVYASHGYLLGAESALLYAGLQDYRARKGQLRQAVVLSSRSPGCDAELVAQTMGITPEKVKELR